MLQILARARCAHALAGRRALLAMVTALGAGCQGVPAEGAPVSVGTDVEVTRTVTFETSLTRQYLSADNGGGGALTARGAAPRAWETLTLTDTNGGALQSGDEVFLAGASGAIVSAEGGGGGAISVTAPWKRDWESFRILKLDGSGVITSGDSVALETKVGTHFVSAIGGGGGEVRADAPWARAWESFTIVLDGPAPAPAPAPPPAPPPSTSTPRQKVLDYFARISGKQTIAGQHDKLSATPSSATDDVRNRTGKQPGLWSGDFLFGGDVDARPTMIAEAKKQWRDGAVVQLMYHACSPTRDERCQWDDIGGAHPAHLSDAEWTQLVTDGTALNAAWLRRLDGLAVFLQDLKSAGVAPLFRPQHEMNQGAFWWGGRKGANGTRRLYQITHDYLVKTKGLDNIVWIWDVQDFDSLAADVDDYNPGVDYYDLSALDVYAGGYDRGKYDAMLHGSRGKPMAIGECSRVPTAGLLAEQPNWVFFMLWPDFIADNGSVLPAVYGAPNVLTEEQMPGWR